MQMVTSNKFKDTDTAKFQLASHQATEKWYTACAKNPDPEQFKLMKDELPILYDKVIQSIISGETRVYEVPDPPTSDRSYFQKMAGLFTSLIWFIYRLHELGGIIFVVIYIAVCLLKYGGCKGFQNALDQNLRVRHMTMVCLDTGLLLTPLILSYFYLQFYEVHSIVITYVAWGILSYLIVVGQWIIDVINPAYHRRVRRYVGQYSFWMAGIDTGSVDLFQVQSKHWRRRESGKKTGYVFQIVFCVIPWMICIIPASVVGFIANYAFEQQFVLDCGEDIVSDLCFDDRYGCCTVIGSWELDVSTSTFLSAVVTNIIGVFAVVKIVILVFATGHPILGSMAAKAK